ncbi:kinase-like protein [Rhizophagus irregularis]|uniref:Kinase-like protein n=1 Tax=Rhizophagus irregularis TaxID=588596 RepID=A0A2I1G4Z5_9GLOM|nr:kinase-like protein [Rhizophagus irregularis]
MGIKNQEMQSEKRQPYLESKQASKDYAETYFNRVYNYLKILPNEPIPSSSSLLSPSEYCFRCKTTYKKNSILWCNECETKLFKENFSYWTSEIDLLDEFIKKTQLTNSVKENYLKLIPFDEFENIILLEEGGYSKVYLASWNNGLYFGTMKGWINEVEKHNDDFIWKLIYDEAPNNVREFGLQSLSLPDNKKKSEGFFKIVNKLKNKRKSLSSKTEELKLWSDRVVARLEYEITERNISFSFSDKSTTGSQYVVLKQLKNSKNINGADFIRQLDSYYTVMSSEKSPKLYGISRDPETNDYILVMQYASGGDLRQYLQDNFVEIDWYQKISILLEIAKGLKAIHDHGYVHHDFHGGNVLLELSESFEGEENEDSKYNVTQKYDILISDLGLCNVFSDSLSYSKKFYGIIPYIAPEILSNIGNDDEKEEIYTKASDVYSFAMIMWELTSGQQFFVHFSRDENLIKEIINDLRPEIIKETPKFYLDLMIKCWDNSPLNRPNINEIIDIIEN